MRLRTRGATVVACAGLAVGAIALPAMAASRTTSITGWRVGHGSATWGDDNTGASSVTKIRMDHCTKSGTTGIFSNAQLALWRQRGIYPDELKGTRTFYCTYSATQSYPSPVADQYYFSLEGIWNQNGVECECYFGANPVVITW